MGCQNGNLRNRDTLFLLCRPTKRISCIKMFKDCNLSNMKLYLNSEFYSYNDLNLGKKRSLSYLICTRIFVKLYYGINCFETLLLNVLSFIEKWPFAIIECSRQNESIKSITVDVHIEFDCKENVSINTTAYCLIIHDCVIEYCPLSNVVRKIIYKLQDQQVFKTLKGKKNQDEAQKFLKNCSSWSYQCLWICKDSSLTRNLSSKK